MSEEIILILGLLFYLVIPHLALFINRRLFFKVRSYSYKKLSLSIIITQLFFILLPTLILNIAFIVDSRITLPVEDVFYTSVMIPGAFALFLFSPSIFFQTPWIWKLIIFIFIFLVIIIHAFSVRYVLRLKFFEALTISAINLLATVLVGLAFNPVLHLFNINEIIL